MREEPQKRAIYFCIVEGERSSVGRLVDEIQPAPQPARRHVDDAGVAEDVLHGPVQGDVLAALADHQAQLRLVVEDDRVLRAQRHRPARVEDRRGRLEEHRQGHHRRRRDELPVA